MRKNYILDLTRLKKLFSIFVVSMPITQYYKSPLPIFNLAMFLAVVFMGLFLLASKGVMRIERSVMPINLFSLLVLFNVVVTPVINHSQISDVNWLYLLRTFLIVVPVMYQGSRFFDREYAIKALETLLILSTGFIVIQLAAKFGANITIPGGIPALISKESYRSGSTRATGFYMEPAAFAQSATLYLTFKLFGEQEWNRTKVRKLAIVAGGVVLSGSGQGLLFLFVLFALWLLYTYLIKSWSLRKLIAGVAIALFAGAAIIAFLRTSYGVYVLSRIISEERGFGGSALSGRTYTNKLFYNLSTVQQWFGVGYGRSTTITSGYINSLFYYLIECGYVSLFFLVPLMLITFLRGDIRVRMFLILYMIMFYFTGCGRVMMLCHYFSFLLVKNERPDEDESIADNSPQDAELRNDAANLRLQDVVSGAEL